MNISDSSKMMDLLIKALPPEVIEKSIQDNAGIVMEAIKKSHDEKFPNETPQQMALRWLSLLLEKSDRGREAMNLGMMIAALIHYSLREVSMEQFNKDFRVAITDYLRDQLKPRT